MKNKSSTKTILIFILAGLLAGIFLKLFIIDFLYISGHSMEPALHNGEQVAVNKLAYGINIPFKGRFLVQWSRPKLNDVVIFLHDNKIVVKRICAVQDSHLDFLTGSQYILKVEDKEIPLTEAQFQNLCQFQQVPAGYVLVLGDNLTQSLDSRDYGFVSVKNITGKIIGK